MKKIFKTFLDRVINYFQKQTAITVQCWDLDTNGTIKFEVEYPCYPPINSLVNYEKNIKYFKIEALEIQNHGGFFCIAYGRFTEEINYGNININQSF